MVKKAELIEPMDGSRPDLTLANNIRKFGFIEPFLIAPVFDAEGKAAPGYRILSGKRRYFLTNDEDAYPAVIVTGFPDAATEEKAEVIVNRVRSLNVLDTADKIIRMRQRGVTDTEMRQDMGFKTGELDKIASILNLAADLQAAVKAGAITPMVALSIAKLPVALQKDLATDYDTRRKDNANARISEADVSAIRQKRAADAIKRDAPTLTELANAAPPVEESAPGVDTQAEKAVGSNSQAAPAKDKKKKEKGAKT